MQQNRRELVKLAVFALQSQGSISAVEFNYQNSSEEINKEDGDDDDEEDTDQIQGSTFLKDKCSDSLSCL